MRRQESNSYRALIITLLLVAVILPFVIYFSASYLLHTSPSKNPAGISQSSNRIDPGPAWLQTRPIMVPDGRKGYLILRTYMRMVNRDAADYVCRSYPRLADEIQEMLLDRPDVIQHAIHGQSSANNFIQKALTSRIGNELFTRTIISQTDQVMMDETDTSRYECNQEQGTRLIFRAKKH